MTTLTLQRSRQTQELPLLDRLFGDLREVSQRGTLGHLGDAWLESHPFFSSKPQRLSLQSSTRTPLTRLHQDETAYYAELDLPGVAADDVAVEVKEDTLSIRGRRWFATQPETHATETLGEATMKADDDAKGSDPEEEGKDSKTKPHLNYVKHFQLPKDADPAQISARIENGTLTLRVTKVIPPEPRSIKVES